MLAVAIFGALSYGALFAFRIAAEGTLPYALVPFGLLLLAGAAAVVVAMLVSGLRALERWRPGE